MGSRIEDYALIGNTHTAALVGKDGSIDWLCMPRFDSGACFAALLGTPKNGRWLIAPEGETVAVRRRYLDSTLVLETEFETKDGVAVVTDFMPVEEHGDRVDVIRIVRGKRGNPQMHTELSFRFDYGRTIPWVTGNNFGLRAIAGPNAVRVRTSARLRGKDFTTVGSFSVAEGQTVPFTLTWYPSNDHEPGTRHPLRMLAETMAFWREWSERCTVKGEWREPVLRSLITLKALTHQRTGGIVAAPTTSLPEVIGGQRNWDYRYCWLRDATMTLYALLISGYTREAIEWREWLVRAVAGHPQDTRIMYGLSGERMLQEFELPWLPGYEKSAPVRVGNGAHDQLQLDVYGEVMDSMHVAMKYGIAPADDAWRVQTALMEFLETGWRQPDSGIWEVRGPRRDFTYSKVMAWVAADRAVKAIERFKAEGPLEKWRAMRDEIHRDVYTRGFDTKRNAFVQYYGSRALDASLLLMPLVGFLPAGDPRVVGTVAAIQRELVHDGLVSRYQTETGVDGLPPGEGAFLACTFWLVDNLALTRRYREAREIFERLLSLRSDLGLLSEEYDPVLKRQVGNFPQAFTHVSLVNSAHNLTLLTEQAPAAHRAE
ncbi:MAG: glycoside hydrolase family 15 protein [Candidatus Binataceae bacterium]